MSLAYPLGLADFWDQLPISACSLDCAPQLETSGTGGGQILTRERAPALWQGTVELGRLMPAEAADVLPLIDLVRQSGASFLVCDLTRPFPALDPNGSVLRAAAVTVAAIAPDRRSLRLAGLPPAYPLSRGDLLGTSWGAAPVRYGMHRLAEDGGADATGTTGWIAVVPALAAGVAIGAAVTIERPAFKALVVPGSVQAGRRTRGLHEGIGFAFIQTMR
jgi:hypothetical protein